MQRDRPLIDNIDHFLRETGMSAIRFGRATAHNPRLVLDLRAGRTPGVLIQKNIEHFMNINRNHPTITRLHRQHQTGTAV